MSKWCVCDTDEPRAATNHSVTWDDDDGEELEVELWNTTGQACLAALRAISYPETDVFLLAYDMTNACSLENLADWLDEIQEVCDDYSGVILVGTKYDLWLEKKDAGDDEICTEEAIAEVTNCSTWRPGSDDVWCGRWPNLLMQRTQSSPPPRLTMDCPREDRLRTTITLEKAQRWTS